MNKAKNLGSGSTEVPKILAVWQPVGYSTHKISKSVGNYYGTKATHTGTLDPLAEGVVIILLGDERFKKQEHTEWKKTYEFEIFFGISTDSYDFMGYLNKGGEVARAEAGPGAGIGVGAGVAKESLEKALVGFVGEYTQKVPIFSAIKYKGKHLFEWGHEESQIEKAKVLAELPEKRGHIYSIKLKGLREEPAKPHLQKKLEELKTIQGNFRQEKIIKQWEKYISKLDPKVKTQVAKISVTTSRGIYVRSLSQDICAKLNTVGFITKLTRIKNGPYTKNKCFMLDLLP
jgi:tRNA pseudouridine(55) synthase